MKRALLLVSAASVLAAGLVVAGPLTPAGPVAPTYKTLNEVQPRTPIDHLPFTVAQPGSYYLTHNLTAASAGEQITVNNYNVTIDLNGFTLTGAPGAYAAIDCGYTGLAVKNGFIVGAGGAGILANNGGCTIDGVIIESCGGSGIQAGIGSVVTNCQARSNAFTGIAVGQASTVTDCIVVGNNTTNTGNSGGLYAGPSSRISGCSALYNSGFGIWLPIDAAAADSTAHANNGPGFLLADRAVADGCFSTSNSTDGFTVTGADATIRACIGRDNSGHGLSMGAMGTVTQCVFQGNAFGAGIFLSSYGSRIQDNEVAGNQYGIRSLAANSSNNLISANTAHANQIGYSVSASDTLAPQAVNPGTNLWPTLSNWANFNFN